MGSFLDKPKTDKLNECGEGMQMNYGLASMQGWRIEMEDSHCALIGLPIQGYTDWSFFAVFDGHAGAKVSQYASDNLLTSLIESIQKVEKNYGAATTSTATNGSEIEQNEQNVNTSTANNKNYNNNNNNNNDIKFKIIKDAIVQGFLDLDAKIRNLPEFANYEDKSGSTAVACLMSPEKIYLINCGDSRAIVVRDDKIVLNTHDHKPANPEERERIQRAGGSVMIQRVNGTLAVSRALGDFEYKMVDSMGPKEQLVSPEPEIYTLDRSKDLDEFVVLACDGIWDVMSNQEIKDFIRYKLKLTSNLVNICNDVLETCLNKGSRDNMSIILVTFPGALRISEEEQEKEKKLNEKLDERVKELIQSADSRPTFSYIMSQLSPKEFDDLPPGGGLCAKKSFLEECYNKYVADLPNNMQQQQQQQIADDTFESAVDNSNSFS